MGIVRVGPVLLGERSWRWLLAAVAYRGRGGREHDAPYAGLQAGSQHPQGAIARGDDQLVGVLGLRGRKWRSDVEDVVASARRLLPAGIPVEVRGEHREPIAHVHLRGKGGADLGLP